MKTILTTETISKDEWDATIQAPAERLDVTMENPADYYPFANRGLCPPLNDTPKPVTVLLAEDRTIVRQGIRAILALEKDIRVIGEASDGHLATELTEKLHPDAVVIGAAIACFNRMQATRHILLTHPAPHVIIIARHADDPYVTQAAGLGAVDYFTEQISAQMLAKTLRMTHKGGYGFNTGKALAQQPVPRARKATSPLTLRQRQVLQLIAEGNSNKQTASALSISIKTVERHRQDLMAALGIHETAGLTRYAISTGIIECG